MHAGARVPSLSAWIVGSSGRQRIVELERWKEVHSVSLETRPPVLGGKHDRRVDPGANRTQGRDSDRHRCAEPGNVNPPRCDLQIRRFGPSYSGGKASDESEKKRRSGPSPNEVESHLFLPLGQKLDYAVCPGIRDKNRALVADCHRDRPNKAAGCLAEVLPTQ